MTALLDGCYHFIFVFTKLATQTYVPNNKIKVLLSTQDCISATVSSIYDCVGICAYAIARIYAMNTL